MKYERVVNLDNVRQNNIVLVDLKRPLPETVFAQEYRQAAQIVREIIKYNNSRSNQDINSPGGSSGVLRDRSGYQTAIPFIGDRGTGKTSVMCSVLRRLDEYSGGDGSEAFYLGKENDKAKFIVLDMIDTNTLKNTEDVLEIILSRILSYLDRYQNRQSFRELYKKMDDLYKDLSQVYWKKTFAPDEPGIIGLKQLTDSQRSIENFRDLVDEFLRCVSEVEHACNGIYLVVALDDIDMYQGTGGGKEDNTFYLLNQIYNYMRIPKMIVLMTFNEGILKRSCLAHFRKNYFDKKALEECTYTEKLEIEKLTRQFLTKLFPTQQRVYMPNFLRIDFANQPNLYIYPMENGEVMLPFKVEDPIKVKDFMLHLIAYKTCLFFDIAGTKKHFFEPRNLREFGAMFQIIDSMEDIPQDEARRDEVYSRNRQILLDYLCNQFAGERLNSEEYMRFEALSMLPLIRQNRFLVDDIRQHRMLVASEEDSLGYLVKSGRDRWKYSYGELLHNLYFATRIPHNEKVPEISFYSKAYIHCILGTHSIIMNQSKYSADEWMEMLGSSIAGRWANDMLPVFFSGESSKKSASLGSVSLPVRSFFNWVIPKNVQNALKKLSDEDANASEKNTVEAFMKALTLLGMFFTRYPESGLRLKLVDEHSEDWSNENPDQFKKEMYLYSATEEHVCFNAFNFVINLFAEENGSCRYLEFIKGKLEKFGITLGEIFKGSFKENWTAILVELFGNKATATENSCIHESEAVIGFFPQAIRQWASLHRNVQFALPVQHFDMMYNIIKRLANESYHDVPEEAPIEEVYDFFRILYNNVDQELEKQDIAFGRNLESNFAQTYRDSLFYKMFTADSKTDSDGTGLIFRNIFRSTMEAALTAQYNRDQYTQFGFGFDDFLHTGEENG